ncbi:hypothetical protein [Pontibacter populi]|uniref:Uncharacterized protein n=1 Tax=Pontibacter populi TaxID=890055 RepID=A0ABV1RTZ6_9BACT
MALLIIFLLIITLGVCYFCYWLPMRLGNKKLGYFIALTLFSFISYKTYEGFYPSDDFYEKEFIEVTGLELKDMEVVESDASYPDMQGDYCSAALIKLGEKEYQDLLFKIQADTAFNGSEQMGSLPLKNVTNGVKLDFEFKASRGTDASENFFIGFLSDNRTIVIEKCKT